MVYQKQKTMTLQQMTIEQLNARKAECIAKGNDLNKLYKRLYLNVDIESPMSTEEKSLKQQISALFSEANQIVLEKRNRVKA